MTLSPVKFVNVNGMPAHQQTVSYSCGAKSVRTYQGGDLVDVQWLVPIRAIRIKPDDIIGSDNNGVTGKP